MSATDDPHVEGVRFEDATWDLTRQLFEAGSNFESYTPIISQLLAQGHEYDTRVLTVDAAVRARFPNKAVSGEFKARVDSAVDKTPKPSRSLALVASLWSPEIARHYGWDKAGTKFLHRLRQLAERYPDFRKDFLPKANAVLVERQERSMSNNKIKSLQQEGRLSPLERQDLDVLLCGEIPDNVDRQNLWTTSRTGSFLVAAKKLSEWRGNLAHQYLLEKDAFGMVAKRSRDDAQLRTPPASQWEGSSPSVVSKPPFTNADISDSETEALSAWGSGRPESGEATSPLFRSQNVDGADAGIGQRPGVVLPEKRGNPATLEDHDSDESRITSQHASANCRRQPKRQRRASFQPYLQPLSATRASLARHTSMGGGSSTLSASYDDQDVQAKNASYHGRKMLELKNGGGEHTRTSSTGESEGEDGNDDQGKEDEEDEEDEGGDDKSGEELDGEEEVDDEEVDGAQVDEDDSQELDGEDEVDNEEEVRESDAEDVSASPTMGSSDQSDAMFTKDIRPQQSELSSIASGGPNVSLSTTSTTTAVSNIRPEEHIMISADTFVGREDLSDAQLRHNQYHDLLNAYRWKIATAATRPGASDISRLRARWLRPETKWAKLYTPQAHDVAFRGMASSEAEAEVLYYDSDVFCEQVREGRVFTRPVVIKEHFTDTNMHSLDDYVALLRDGYSNAPVDIKTIDHAAPQAMPIGWFCDEIIASCHSLNAKSTNALNLQPIAGAHRPKFTFLARYQLLKSLSARVQGAIGKQTTRNPSDVTSCGLFDILGLPGAFSGAHVDALTGTWIRNLSGVKLWMIVPEQEMEGQWETFAEHGPSWDPDGRERLVLLEKDDVLFMPPGCAVVHAVHTMQTSLMEGGMLWDYANIIDTLNAVHWIATHQDATNEPLPWELPRIVAELVSMVEAGDPRFTDHGWGGSTFGNEFQRAVQQLQALGCNCIGDCGVQSCSCLDKSRRCTQWCNGHPGAPDIEGDLECMCEQAEGAQSETGSNFSSSP